MDTKEIIADLYFEGGTIYTVDEKDSLAEALAVKNGKIIFVGSAKDGEVYKGNTTEILNLEGGMLLPGFFDTHIHSVGMNAMDFDLLSCHDLDSSVLAIRNYIEQNPDKDVYYGFGYLTDMFTGEEAVKGPKKERLDVICPDKPIIIYSNDGHSVWLNTKFFEYSNITNETDAPTGGTIEKNDDTGELWGTIRDNAMILTPEPVCSPEKIQRLLLDFQKMLNSKGYTSILTHPAFGMFPVPFEQFQALEQKGLLSLKVRGSVSVVERTLKKDLATLVECKEKYNSYMVKAISAKIFVDGVVDSHTAYLLEPYTDKPDFYGVPSWEPEKLGFAFAEINKAGMQIHVHSVGDAGTRMTLNALEYARKNAKPGDYRNSITHLQLVDPDDIKRFAELNVIAAAQPFWHFKQGEFWIAMEHTALGERANYEYPLKSFLDAGVILSFSSDFPITADINPFIAIETGITRNLADGKSRDIPDITDMDDPTYLLGPEQRVSVRDMIRGYTANSAYATFQEKETGSLEVGKAADMIVVNQNFLEIDPLSISDTIILRTYLDGALVYSAE